MRKILALVLTLALSGVAAAQTGPNHAVPIAKGAGTSGFRFAGPCLINQALVWGGVTVDPTCTTIGGTGTVTSIATNNGITGGTITSTGTIGLATIAADRLLGNASGSTTFPSAVAIGSCSAASSALTYNTSTHAFGCNTISGAGTVTSASVVSANGFAGTVATATTTPAITLTTTITGILSGNGTAIATAAAGSISNSLLANAATTVNGQTCTLGSTCTISASAGTITSGTTVVAGGTTTRVLFDNAGVLGEYPVTGTGNAVLSASPTFSGTAVIPAITNTSINGLGITANGSNVLNITSGKTLTAQNTITLIGTDVTTWTGASTNMTLAALNIASQTVTGGFNFTTLAQSTGNLTVNCGSRATQSITNSGAFTITAPSSDNPGCVILVTNDSAAGAITFSGFTVPSTCPATACGDALTLTDTNKFSIMIWRVAGTSGYRIAAHQ